MRKLISEIKNTEPKREHGDISSLRQSIAEVGLINPITVDEMGNILAGCRRYQAVKELGWQEVDVRVISTGDNQLLTLKIAIDENLKRKDLTEPEVAAAIKEYDELKKKLEGQACGHGVTADSGWSYQKTADDLGISKPAVVKAIKIGKAIEEHPELAGKSGQAILAAVKRLELKTAPAPLGKYHTIVIDPPWPVEKIIRDVTPNQYDFDYPTMSIDEIKALPITEIADDSGCHIYLWATQKFLPVGFEVLKHWGFSYIFTMVWHKRGGFQPFNLPQYNCEFVLFGRLGGMPFETTKGFSTCFTGERREHSRKPDEFYDLVRRVSPERRIDIFSREKRKGFEQYGNETSKF